MSKQELYQTIQASNSLLCLMAATLLLAMFNQAALAEAQTGKRPFHIPAQQLNKALIAFIKQSHQQLLYSTELTENRRSRALEGDYTPDSGLALLLGDAPLVAVATGAGTITLRPRVAAPNSHLHQVAQENITAPGTSADTTLPKVTVEADSAYDPEYYADPYNKHYVIPNATAGTKTDTPIMETPLNVQVISKQVLKDQQVINLGQALKNTSGVTRGSFAVGVGNPGAPNQLITLRGFASETFFRNGFRLTEGSASREMANVESVEILKGPAAILYGLVEPGGMVNVTTKQPLTTPYYALNQQFGSYDLYRTTIDTSGPLTKDKDLLYRMNFSYENSASFRDFVFNDSLFLAPVLKWNISPKTQATLEMEYQHKKFGNDVGFVPIINNQILNVPISRNYGEPSPGEQDTIFVGLNWSHQFNDDWAIKHRFSVNKVDSFVPESFYPVFHFGDPATLASFQTDFPNLRIDHPNSVYRLLYFNQKANTDTYSTNLDLTGYFETLSLKHTLLIGGDYYRIDQASSQFNDSGADAWLNNGDPEMSNIDLFNPVHPGRNPQVIDPATFTRTITKTDQYGLYIQDQIKLPYNLHVMGGIRYQYLHQTSANQDSSGATTLQDPTTQDAVTPRVGILWQPQSWLSLYANYAESFGANTGRAFVSPGVNKSIDPSSATQYEGGIKTEFFGGRLRATLAYYDLTKTNVASGDPRHLNDCNGPCSLAIGEIRSRGPELDITGEILPGWNMIATWANTDVRITKTNSENEPFFAFLPVGSRYWGVPRNTASLFTTYEFQQDLLKGLKIGGGVNIQDSQLACCTNPLFKVAGFTTVDLLASYTLDVKDAKISAQLNVNNLLDKRYYTGGGVDSPSGLFATFGQPRTFMGSISVQY